MNSFETDMKRAVLSVNFFAGILLQVIILCRSGMESDLFHISIPVVSALPYSTAWLMDHKSGFIKEYLPRCGITGYIAGKFLACGLSGGAVCSISFGIYQHTPYGKGVQGNLFLLFLSGMLWACVAVTLAAVSDSRYIAYGGAFVIFYILVILYERYFRGLYCLYPIEWYDPKHTWIFGDTGIALMCGEIILMLYVLFYETVRRQVERA